MPRVLHLVDPTWPGGGPPTLRLAALATTRLTSCRHEVIVLGGRRELELAIRCGLTPLGSLSLPAGFAPFALSAVRRAVRAAAEREGGYRLVHAWSGRAAIAAAALEIDRRVVTLDRGAQRGLQQEMLGVHIDAEDVLVLATGRAAAAELLADGVARRGLRVLPPAVEDSTLDGVGGTDDSGRPGDGKRDTGVPDDHDAAESHRAALRRHWGVGRRGVVMGLLGAPPDAPDVRNACFILALLRAAERDAFLLVHPAAPGLERMRRWAQAPGLCRALAGRIVVDPRVAEPWRVAPGLDVGLALGEPELDATRRALGSPLAPWIASGRPRHRPPAVWPSIWLARAGVPTVAEATAQAAEYVVEGRTGLLVAPGDYAAAAHRVMRLADDPQQTRRLGTAAREVVAELHDPSSFAVRLKCVYDALMHHRSVPDPLPGVEASEPELVQPAVGAQTA